jgi:hypothetical protein
MEGYAAPTPNDGRFLMPAQTAGQLADQLRDAIARLPILRPGTAALWRAVCEVKALQRALVTTLVSGDPAAVPTRTSQAG